MNENIIHGPGVDESSNHQQNTNLREDVNEETRHIPDINPQEAEVNQGKNCFLVHDNVFKKINDCTLQNGLLRYSATGTNRDSN